MTEQPRPHFVPIRFLPRDGDLRSGSQVDRRYVCLADTTNIDLHSRNTIAFMRKPAPLSIIYLSFNLRVRVKIRVKKSGANNLI